MDNLFIDIHAVQTVPPSCVNRDDTGSPKTAIYGGVERSRVSSQAWKHAMREYFCNVFSPEKLGSRTKKVPQMIADAILQISPDFGEEKARAAALEALKAIGIKVDDGKLENAAMFFISREQIKALANLAVTGKEKNEYKKECKKAIKENPSIDILLFGRMVADDPDLNYDAVSQVAHAISTHAVHTEYDYFTAVDDEQAEDQSGAGHLGTIEFNSSTMYRYATINMSELFKFLGSEAPKVAAGFIEAFVRSMPTGKQNTFANRTLPDMVYVTVRKDQPVNFAGAFESAVKNTGTGYAEKSCTALLEYAKKMYQTFAEAPELALGCGGDSTLINYAETMPFNRLLTCLEDFLDQQDKEEKS